MADIDPIEFGRLLESVEQLTKTLERHTVHVDALNVRLTELESRWKLGKAGIVGLVLGVGFAVNGIVDTLQKLRDALFP